MIQRHGLPSSLPPTSRRVRRRRARILLATTLSVWSVGVLPAFAVAIAPRADPTPRAAQTKQPGATGVQPSIQYEEAMAHAGDRPDFAPGARVVVPFRPRASDGWPVDGAAPIDLPAGRVDGAALRREATGKPGTTARDAVPSASVDQPTASVSAPGATLSSWSPSTTPLEASSDAA